MDISALEDLSVNRVLVENFLRKVDAVDEAEYGDAMREWNKNLLILREKLVNPSVDVQRVVDGMQMYIQFHPNWDVESTLERIHFDVQRLRHLLIDRSASSHLAFSAQSPGL